MKKFLFLLVAVTVFSSCEKKATAKKEACAIDSTSAKDKKFEMYEMSEMAALMDLTVGAMTESRPSL